MKLAVTILEDTEGVRYVMADGKPAKIDEIDAQKALVKKAAGCGLRIGKRTFISGMVVSQYGTEYRKTFPVATTPPVEA